MKPFKTIAIAALAASVAGTALTASLPAYAQSGAANSDGGQEIQEMTGKRFAHMGKRGGEGRGYGKRGGRQRAERLFERFDTDGDGIITAAEIEAVRAADFTAHDTDSNGDISLEEFKAAFLTRSNDKMVRAFQFLDTNGDGTVTQEEVDTAANRMFNRLDRDGNGVVEKVRGQGGKRGQGAGQGGQQGQGPADGSGQGQGSGQGKGQGQRADAGERGEGRGGKREGRGMRGMGRDHGQGHGGPQMMFMSTFDTNGDGTVTREDFDAKRAELFALADINGSGSFTKDDFSPLWLAINDGRVVNMFQRADADGSLGITAEEHDERASRLMEKADRNGDGVLTKADFKRGKKGKHGKGKQRG
ncbi:MAG: calcium-binding protein [Roseibium sp.]